MNDDFNKINQEISKLKRIIMFHKIGLTYCNICLLSSIGTIILKLIENVNNSVVKELIAISVILALSSCICRVISKNVIKLTMDKMQKLEKRKESWDSV